MEKNNKFKKIMSRAFYKQLTRFITKDTRMKKETITVTVTTLLFTIAISGCMEGKIEIPIEDYIITSPIRRILPPPDFTHMNLETSINRRMSVRDFDGIDITDQELSNILWAAYGFTESGKRTIHSPNGRYAIVIYVIKRDNTYTYLPETHTLTLFREGDFTDIGLYDTAPVKLGLVWETAISSNEHLAWTELGMIGQNIYCEANALNLGTVTTSSSAEELHLLQLPSSQRACIVMPLGHPRHPYDFTYDPLPVSNLPSVVQTSTSLEDAINNRQEADIWINEPLTIVEQSQILWASYGYSVYIDNNNGMRHRTVPSAMGTYPLQMYAANHTGVYRYNPSTHGVVTIAHGDRRSEINAAVDSPVVLLSSAPWILLSFLDTRIGQPEGWRLNAWFYEAGAVAHTMFLECTALNVSANVVHSGIDDDMLRTAIGLSSETYLIPLLLMPSGKTASNTPPLIPDIYGPTEGTVGISYTYTTSTIDPDGNQISYLFDWGDGTNSGWTPFVPSGTEGEGAHIWYNSGNYEVKVKAKDNYSAESNWATLTVTMPKSKPAINPLLVHFWQRLLDRFLLLAKLLDLSI
jgi:nitroreductase